MDPQQRLLLEVVYEALEDGKSSKMKADRHSLIAGQLESLLTRSEVPEHQCTVAPSHMTMSQ
jgi:hypothetical protein